MAEHYPSEWIPGQLLDVRNTGHHWQIKRLEDYGKSDAPELLLPNASECQAFVSWWYFPGRDERYTPQVADAPQEATTAREIQREAQRVQPRTSRRDLRKAGRR